MTAGEPLTMACLGCGARAQTYAELAARRPERFQVVAGADPQPERVAKLSRLAHRADFRRFAGGAELLAAGRLADVMIVATPDSRHYEDCRAPCRPAITCCWRNPSPRAWARSWRSSAWQPASSAA